MVSEPIPAPADVWQTMNPFEQAVAWKDVAPDISERMLRHYDRQNTRAFILQCIDRVVGLMLVIGLGFVAWHYADVGAPVSGLAVFGSGAAASSAAVVGLRRLTSKPKKQDRR